MNVAAKESCSMPGASLSFEIRDELGVSGAAFLALLALSLLFFPLSVAALFFGAFGLDGLGSLLEVYQDGGDLGFDHFSPVVVPGFAPR
jgi:hypothetical protein